MASYHHLLQHTKPRYESPAKVFAKLKSKVQREGMCAKEENTGKAPLCNGREKHETDFRSPKKRTESTWLTDELKENQRFGSYRNEAQALTLSPISSPRKTFGYSCSDISNKPVEEMPPMTEIAHGCTPKKRAYLESTAMSHPVSVINGKQIHTEPPRIRNVDGFNGTRRTPVKIHPGENDCVRSVFEDERHPLMSQAYMFSPMRKRKCEPWGLNTVSSSAKGVNSEDSQPKERKTSSAFNEDDTLNTCMEDLGHVRGFSADQSEMNQFTHEPMFPPPRSAAKNCYPAVLEQVPPMSPAKMFAYMKERESKIERQEVHKVSSSTRDLVDGGDFHPSRNTPPSTVHSADEMEDAAFTSVPENMVPASLSRLESADSQSDTDPSVDVLTPAVPSKPVLLQDPLVLNTPRVSIPKKNETMSKPNRWSQRTNFPSESVIYLKKWFLRRTHKGLFVDGIHREDNIPWNSNIIIERVSNSVLKTVSGRVYILVGKMNTDIDSGFPKWLLKKFLNGFPPNWKALYEKFLSKSKDDTSRGKERKSERRGIIAKTKSDTSSINISMKPHRQKRLRTSDSCPSASSSVAKVSRSGRVIKPPLEYWKGGRVILDAFMNVTIHEGYDTSILSPEITTTVSTRASQKPALVFLPCSEGHKQCESSSNEEASAPLRRAKPPVRKRNRAKVNSDEKTSLSSEPPVETQSSPEEWSGRRTRSGRMCSATEKTLHVDTMPQKQREAEKSSISRSRKQTDNFTKPSLRVSRRKQGMPASPESPSLTDKISQDQSPNSDFSVGRKKRERGVHRKRGEKSQPSPAFPSSNSSESAEESGRELRNRTRVTNTRDAAQAQTKNKQNKNTKTSQPVKTLSNLTKYSNKHTANKNNTLIPEEQNENQWTEVELTRLKEAVSLYPKHVAGYWAKVARIVGTRSAEECHSQHTSQGTSQTPAKRAKKPKKKKMEAPKDPVTDHPVISARAGTLKRKQQVRQFLETMPREDVDDVFSSAYMQNKRFEIPSMCPSEDHDFMLSDLEPMTPSSTGFPEIKTPQCLHITPGMMGSPNASNDDKYIFQLQKRMKKRQFNVCKPGPSSKSFTPTPSVKRTMRRCGNTENDSFVVWEMFSGNDGALSESGEEKDFYFSDND